MPKKHIFENKLDDCKGFLRLINVIEKNFYYVISLETLKYRAGVQQGNPTSWGEGASVALIGHPFSHGVTIKMPYGVVFLHQPALHPIFSYWVG